MKATLTGAHEPGLEYGVNAAEIAADNMAAHVAEMMTVDVLFNGQVQHLVFQWRQPYSSFVNQLIELMKNSECPLSRRQAAIPYEDFRSSIRWKECQPLKRSTDSLSMLEVVLPIYDDDATNDCRVFKVIVTPAFEVTDPGVLNLFGTEDIVAAVLESLKPWYEPHNVRVLIAFSATCWGALRVVRQVLRVAALQDQLCLPSPIFLNGRPSALEAQNQWDPDLDKWLRPWSQVQREYDRLDLWIDNDPLLVRQMDRLHSARMISDVTINAFMTLLSLRVDQCPVVTYFAKTDFYDALCAKYGSGWHAVERWFKPWRRGGRRHAKIKAFYFPIHDGQFHYVGAKVTLVPQEDGSLRMELFGMDSLSVSMRDEYVRLYTALHAGFTSEWVKYGEASFLEGPMDAIPEMYGNVAAADLRVHVVGRQSTPAQRNGIDCGIFVVRWIEYDSLGLQCDYSQLEMIHFRRLTYIELSHGRIIRRVVTMAPTYQSEYPLALRFKNQVLSSKLAGKATELDKSITSQPSRLNRRRGREQEYGLFIAQKAFNITLDPSLVSVDASGVVALTVCQKDAQECAATLKRDWLDGCLKLPNLEVKGFNTYTTTLSKLDSEQQRLHTLLVTEELLPSVRSHLPGFHAMECEIVKWLEEHYKTKVELFQAHGLRQGPRTMSSTGFAVHQDNEIFKFIEYSVVVKLTPDEPDEAPSAMRVVGAPVHFQYGNMAGACGCFLAGLWHASVEPKSVREHLKLTFFFKVAGSGKARLLKKRSDGNPSSGGGGQPPGHPSSGGGNSKTRRGGNPFSGSGGPPPVGASLVPTGETGGMAKRRKSYEAVQSVEEVLLDTSDPEENARHAARLKPMSSDEDEAQKSPSLPPAQPVPPVPVPPAPPASTVAPSEVAPLESMELSVGTAEVRQVVGATSEGAPPSSDTLAAPVKVPQFSYVANMKVEDIRVALRALGLTPRGRKKDMIKQLKEALRDPDEDHLTRKNASKADIEAGIRRLENVGYQIFNVLDDGACFFRCLALHYDGDEAMHDKYRTEVTNKLHKYKEIIGTSLERGPHESVDAAVTKLATKLRASDEWVGEDGILASALALEVEIVVYDVKHAEPLRYNTPSSFMQLNPKIEVFYDGEHYQYLRHVDGERRPRPVFPERKLYGDMRDDAAQVRFDADAARWGRHVRKHDDAEAAWKKREQDMDQMMPDQRMQDGSGSESESESSKRRKTDAAEEEGEGHSTDRLGGEHGEAAVTGSADDVANKPGMQRIYKPRGQSITGNRLSSEHRMIGMGLSSKKR